MLEYSCILNDIIIIERNFPQLQTNLPKEQKAKLMVRLQVESEEIIRKFGSLVCKVEKNLETSKVKITADNLITFLANCSSDKVADHIKISDTIPMVMRKIKKYKGWSFFDYELLHKLIETHCSGVEISKDYQNYVSQFKEYCKRRLFEVPASAFPPSKDSIPNFVVKLDKNFSVQMKYVKETELKLSKILDVELKLLDVKGGCFELTLRYLGKKMIIIELNQQEKKLLEELEVKWLCYADTYELYNQESCVGAAKGIKGKVRWPCFSFHLMEYHSGSF